MTTAPETAYTWSVYAVHPGHPLRNSVIEMQIPGTTPRDAIENLEFPDEVAADHEGAFFFVVREDHVPGRNGAESVTHDHALFTLNTEPRWDRV